LENDLRRFFHGQAGKRRAARIVANVSGWGVEARIAGYGPMGHRRAMGVTGALAMLAWKSNIGRDDGMRRPADQPNRFSEIGG
jgi:hypothetical protein